MKDKGLIESMPEMARLEMFVDMMRIMFPKQEE